MASQEPGPGLLPHRQLESWLASRLMRYMEPKVEGWVRAFLGSEAGEAMLADVVGDVVGDLFDPKGPGEGGLAERIVLALVARYMHRPGFHAQVEAMVRAPAAVNPRH